MSLNTQVNNLKQSLICNKTMTASVKGKISKVDSETCYNVWLGEGDANKKRGVRAEDAKILIASD